MATTEPPAKKRKLDFTDEYKVVVGVGATQKTYSVIKQILTKSSEFFTTACKDCWVRGRKRTINLPEVDPSVFDTYLQLLLTGEVVANEEIRPPSGCTVEDSDSRQRFFKAIIDTYCLADMLLDTPSKNACMDHLINSSAGVASFGKQSLIEQVYSATVPSSPLRRFVVDFAIYWSGRNLDYWTEILADHPPQFTVDLALGFMTLRKDKKRPVNPELLSKCTYHDHDDSNPKHKCLENWDADLGLSEMRLHAKK